jgi:hypothetical protein
MTFNQFPGQNATSNIMQSVDQQEHGFSLLSNQDMNTLNRNSIVVQNQQIYEELNQVKAERDRYHQKLLRVRDKVKACSTSSTTWGNQ